MQSLLLLLQVLFVVFDKAWVLGRGLGVLESRSSSSFENQDRVVRLKTWSLGHTTTRGVVRRRGGVGPRTVAVQAGLVRPDSDAGQHDVHPDGDEYRPLPGHLSPAPAHLQTKADARRVMAVGARLRHSPALHLQTGLGNRCSSPFCHRLQNRTLRTELNVS